jgi:hypothetical protein
MAEKRIRTKWNVKKYAPSIWDKEGYSLSVWDMEKRNSVKLKDPNKKKETK